MGGGYLMLLEQELGTQLYERAFERGVNYFDGRYGDSSVKLRPVIKRDRARCVVGSKTADPTAKGAMARVEEDLAILETDYLDVYYLRCYSHEMLEERLAPGGPFEGLVKARHQGKIRAIGMANHSDPSVLVAGIETGLVDVVIFPLNVVRRDALATLIPVAQEHDVGLVVMKPLSVGKLPAHLALRWLRTQPIHTIAAGMSALQHLEIDLAAVEQEPAALSAGEKAEAERIRQARAHTREACRLCQDLCQSVCEQKLPIPHMIHTDVLHEHYRNLGLEAFLEYPLTAWAKKSIERHFVERLERARACTHCGLCEEQCPQGVPIMDLLEQMLEDHPPLIAAVQERGWQEQHADAVYPFQSRRGQR